MDNDKAHNPPAGGQAPQGKDYAGLYRRFILITLTCSLAPLLLVGWGINIHYSRFARSRMTDAFQSLVDNHRKTIELFLDERSSCIKLLAETHSLSHLLEDQNLRRVFEVMNQGYGESFTDLGIIDEQGRHLAYVGPYDLMDKNYSQAFWFKEVMKKGVYISDMFMGFRKVPHFIIAVTRTEGSRRWILRATIDTEAFRSLVEDVKIGRTGEVYLVSREGVFQTSPRFSGTIMEKSPRPVAGPHQGIRFQVVEEPSSPRRVIAQAWLRDPPWMLVVSQEYSEAFDDVNHANYATLIFLHLSALSILLVSILTGRHMIKMTKKRDLEAENLNRQLVQAGKLASIGELSAGVAHEINNPLAIIMTEKQLLLDQARHTPGLDPEFKSQLLRSVAQIESQLHRCKVITHNLLRFARRTVSTIEVVDLNDFIREVVGLVEREAGASGVKFRLEPDPELRPIMSDPSQLQQVFLNLINNAVDAHQDKPYGSVTIATASEDHGEAVRVTIADTGQGIAPELLEKIFDPFFTTKGVGRGTGLGLSICYSIIRQLGGEIRVESDPGKGSVFTIVLPRKPPAQLKESIAEGAGEG